MARRQLPALHILHERHSGITPALCAAYAEAASVVLDEHHLPPADVELISHEETETIGLDWQVSSERIRRAYHNRDDATRDGAYAVALATVELAVGLVAVHRAETLSGADYYVDGPETQELLETAHRLEVSGTDRGDRSDMRSRLKEKIEQLRKGRVTGPGFACVVGFREGAVMLAEVDG